MKMQHSFATLLLAACLATASLAAELLDRIAVTVEGQVITEQEVYEQTRIAAFLDGKQPEFTQQSLRDTADRMVMQQLLLRDMRANGFPEPTEEQVQEMLQQFQQTHWGSEDAFWKAAQQEGISREALREFLRNLVGTVRYIDFRFRPAIRATDTTLLERYQVRYPATQGSTEPPPFDEVRDALEREMIDEGVDQAVDRWLEDAKSRIAVRYRPEVLP